MIRSKSNGTIIRQYVTWILGHLTQGQLSLPEVLQLEQQPIDLAAHSMHVLETPCCLCVHLQKRTMLAL